MIITESTKYSGARKLKGLAAGGNAVFQVQGVVMTGGYFAVFVGGVRQNNVSDMTIDYELIGKFTMNSAPTDGQDVTVDYERGAGGGSI